MIRAALSGVIALATMTMLGCGGSPAPSSTPPPAPNYHSEPGAIPDASASEPGASAPIPAEAVAKVAGSSVLTKADVKVSWVIFPAKGKGETATRQIDLVIDNGLRKQRITLGSFRGQVKPEDQGACTTSLPPSVMVSYGGGTRFTAVKGESELTIERTDMTDGYCPTKDCDKKTEAAKIALPAGAVVTYQTVEADAKGKETPFACPKH